MAGLEWLTCADFVDWVGDTFEVAVGDAAAASFELLEAAESTEPGGRGPDGTTRMQFSLVFRGPTSPLHPQGTYRLAHADLGELDLFLVPVGSEPDGIRYQAAFA